MSEQKAIVTNIYQVLDNELSRMHDLLKIAICNPQQHQQHTSLGVPYYSGHPSDAMTTYKRIQQMQDIILSSFSNRDEKIQQMVAELALTGAEDAY